MRPEIENRERETVDYDIITARLIIALTAVALVTGFLLLISGG